MTSRVRLAHVATIDLTLRVLLLPQLLRLREDGFDVTAISAPGPWVQELEDRGLRHIAWSSATRAWDPLADIRALGELVRILRRERFDLVHTHNAKPGVLGRIAARMLGVPCVLNTVHGFDARPDDGFARRFAFMGSEWMAARFSDLELYQSSADLARARRLHMKPASEMILLGNGIDLARFDPATVSRGQIDRMKRELGIPSGHTVVGTVGRLVGDKGYRELLLALHEVRRRVPNVTFLAIGDRDPQKSDSLTDDEMTRAGDHVIFAGWREDMPLLYSLMDVFVLASWREGVPRAAMEAAAMGKPLILSDIPGCREIARDDIEAVFFPVRDERRLGAAIEELLQDPATQHRLGLAARERALGRFDERRVAEVVTRVSRDALRRRGRVALVREVQL